MIIFEILKKNKAFPFQVLILGLVNSFVYTSILMLINRILSGTSTFFGIVPDWLLFVFAICVSYIFSNYFQSYLTRTMHNLVFTYEVDFIQKIRMTSYEDYERLGRNRVLSGVQDTRVMASAPQIFISVFNAVIVIICSLSYIFYINYLGGLLILTLMGMLFWIYMRRNKSIERDLNRLRDTQNDYFRHLSDLMHGFKEVKMSTNRNELLFRDYLLANRVMDRDLGIKTRIRDLNNELMGNFSWYVVIGLIMYVLPVLLGLKKEGVTTLVISILYMMGPVSTLILFIFDYTRIKIAYERINVLNKELSVLPVQEINGSTAMEEKARFTMLRFQDVKYEYRDTNNGKTFTLGPVNLRIQKGETIFITGGNGSGKSTFINLLTGLYKSADGTIYYNDVPIEEQNRTWYSNKISAVFSDAYLFRENYNGFDLSDANNAFTSYIDLLKMTEIWNMNREKNGMKTALSKGQQKRMALIYCLLENRELFVLDEWAAEQDPEFRKYFYTVLLPLLKDWGKTVIAVTHDDRYFSYADRILKFDYGKLVSDNKTTRESVKHES